MKTLRFVLLATLLPALAHGQPTPSASSVSNIAGGPAIGVAVKQPSELDAKGFLGVIGQKITLHATLRHRSTHAPIPGKRVIFVINGKQAEMALTDAAGEATVHYTVPNEAPGLWPVGIGFAGDDAWHPASAGVKLGVFQASTKLTLTKSCSYGMAMNEGETICVDGVLVRTSDGAGIDGRAVSLTIDGKGVGKPSTGDGKFTFHYKIPAGASPKVHVQGQFEGDVLYAASAATLEFPVKPPAKKATLSASDGKGKRGDTITVKALVLPANPMLAVNGLVGGIGVKFTASKPPSGPHIPLCTTQTVSDGRASCTVKLDLPETYYSLYATAINTNDEWSIPETFNQLVILSSPVRLVVTGPGSARIGDTIHVKVRLTRTTDDAPLSDRTVALQGSAAPLTTNAAGEATFTFAVPNQGGVGARHLKASYAGQPDQYEKGEATFTLQVSPSVS